MYASYVPHVTGTHTEAFAGTQKL